MTLVIYLIALALGAIVFALRLLTGCGLADAAWCGGLSALCALAMARIVVEDRCTGVQGEDDDQSNVT